MLALTKVKKDIDFNKQFHSVIDVLKSIAIAQFYALSRKLEISDLFDETLKSFFDSIDTARMIHPFLQAGEEARCVIAITSNQGLLGGLNMRVVSAAVNLMKSDRDQLIIVGDQGKTLAQYARVSCVAFPGVRDEARESQALSLRNYVFNKMRDGAFRQLQAIYPHAVTLVNHRVEMVTLLPLPRREPSGQTEPGVDLSNMILESSLSKILEYLAYLWVGRKLADLFGLSRLAELAARYVHLEESGQKIQDLNKKLKLRYFRLRHEMIDAGMRELFSARALYA